MKGGVVLKKIVSLVLSVALMFMFFTNTVSLAESEKKIYETKECDFEYKEYDSNSIWITKVTIKDASVLTLQFPELIEKKVVNKIGPDKLGDKFITGKTKFNKIVLPAGANELTQNAFSCLEDGAGIVIPSKLVAYVKDLCKIRWSSFSVSEGNSAYTVKNNLLLSKDCSVVYGNVGASKAVVIPEGVKTIWYEAFFGNQVNSLKIPKTVKKIKDYFIGSVKSLKISISKSNKTFALKNGCLYNKKTGQLHLAVAKKGVVKIPNKVKSLAATSFAGKVKKIIVPKSVKKVRDGWLEELEYRSIYKGKINVIFEAKKFPKRVGKINPYILDTDQIVLSHK